MKQILLAAITGFALAAGMLGFYAPEAGSAQALPHPALDANHSPQVEYTPLPDSSPIVASHDNANTEAVNVGLNGNLIRGQSTLICTADPAMHDAPARSG